MNKVLLISFHFPPYPAIGSERPYRLSKYLPNWGWEPVVLTAKLCGTPPTGGRVIQTEYRDILGAFKSKIGFKADKGIHQQLGIEVHKNYSYPTYISKSINLLRQVIAFPDDRIGWYRYAVKRASALVQEEKIDAIISTSAPVTCHVIARALKNNFNIPWVADLRDLWSQNPYDHKSLFLKYADKRMELRTLCKADAIVTVTAPWIATLSNLHKDKKIYCITNGYDKEDYAFSSGKLTEKFTITYTGALYNGKRDPSMLFQVMNQLIYENKVDKNLIEIRFFSRRDDWLQAEINKYNLNNIVKYYGYLPREIVLERQKESQLLLILLWDDEREYGFCPGKIYEYLGARRPIVAIGGAKSVVKDILKKTNAGRYADNPDVLRKIILDYYNEFTKFGNVSCQSNSTIEHYSYDFVAKKYADILNYLPLRQ